MLLGAVQQQSTASVGFKQLATPNKHFRTPSCPPAPPCVSAGTACQSLLTCPWHHDSSSPCQRIVFQRCVQLTGFQGPYAATELARLAPGACLCPCHKQRAACRNQEGCMAPAHSSIHVHQAPSSGMQELLMSYSYEKALLTSCHLQSQEAVPPAQSSALSAYQSSSCSVAHRLAAWLCP